ncbi:MAG: diversity-generating retroelement protein Avd [Candidatus Stygibacter australis]|nr:diversity-generating retroelement protein Avd [Candidatus Stygibacter australis]
MNENYPVFTKWMLILELIMDRAEGIPKSVRYSLTSRILNYANDILELVIEAIYSKEKAEKIDRMNLLLEKLRVYVRICEKRNYISHKQYYRLSVEFNEFGKMIGGWKKGDHNQQAELKG